MNVEHPVDRLMKHCSSWTKLRRFVAWFLRLKKVLIEKAAMKKSSNRDSVLTSQYHNKNFLTVDDMNIVEIAVIRYEQHKHFTEDIHVHILQKPNGKLKGPSPLRKLDPFRLDNVIRVEGRLDRANIADQAKHPVIIPAKSCIGTLILRDVHESIGHPGKNSILTIVRQKYWILRASSAIKSLDSKCVICRKYQAKTQQQKMADLPADRLTPDEPPFGRTGIDYFGPFEVKRGVIFTCLNTRAVHLEMAHSLTTDSCINAVRRIIARRGAVKMWSDNGTNLVGCDHELRSAIREWNQSPINNELLQKGMQWTHNPPSGSHHGGVWERMIRSIRKILYSLMKLQTKQLDGELLVTLFCEVEAIINSRPLTEVPVDLTDLKPLTPNYLLLLDPEQQPSPGVFESHDSYARKRWRQVQYLANVFWSRWVKEYVHLLQTRQKWLFPNRNLEIDDVVDSRQYAQKHLVPGSSRSSH